MTAERDNVSHQGVAATSKREQGPLPFFILTVYSLLLIAATYEIISRVTRADLAFHDISARLSATCSELSALHVGDAAEVPTRPPPRSIHVVFVLCPRDAFTDAQLSLASDEIHDAAAVVQGKLLKQATRLVRRKYVPDELSWGEDVAVAEDDVWDRRYTLSRELPSVQVAVASRRECISNETFTIHSILDASIDPWVVLLEGPKIPAGDGAGAGAPSCTKLGSSQRIRCRLASVAEVQRVNSTKAPRLRLVVASAVMAALGQAEEVGSLLSDTTALERYLRQRQISSCQYAASAIAGLAHILDVSPTMPLQRAVGEAIQDAVTRLVALRGVVHAANDIQLQVSHPSIVPQGFLPLEHVLAIHLSFLMPFLVAVVAGLGATLKFRKMQLKKKATASS